MKKIRRFVGVAVGAGLIVGSPHMALAVPVDVSGSTINFIESIDIGEDALVNTTHTYVDVLDPSLPDVDAKVTISALNNSAVFFMDEYTDTVERNGELQLSTDILTAGGYVEVTIEFFVSGTSTPVTLSGIKINVKDVDNNQWVEFSNIASYLLATGSNLVVQTNSTNSAVAAGSTRFWEPNGEPDDVDSPLFWAESTLNSTSSVVFRVGSSIIDTAGFDVTFAGAAWTVPTGSATTTVPQERLVSAGMSADNWLIIATSLVAIGMIAVASAGRIRRPGNNSHS